MQKRWPGCGAPASWTLTCRVTSGKSPPLSEPSLGGNGPGSQDGAKQLALLVPGCSAPALGTRGTQPPVPGVLGQRSNQVQEPRGHGCRAAGRQLCPGSPVFPEPLPPGSLHRQQRPRFRG